MELNFSGMKLYFPFHISAGSGYTAPLLLLEKHSLDHLACTWIWSQTFSVTGIYSVTLWKIQHSYWLWSSCVYIIMVIMCINLYVWMHVCVCVSLVPWLKIESGDMQYNSVVPTKAVKVHKLHHSTCQWLLLNITSYVLKDGFSCW